MNIAWAVFWKELVDALRDRKTLVSVLLSSVIVGPLILFFISSMVSDIESRAEKREVVVQGIEHAPTLRNFLERQTYSVKAAPADYEKALKDSTLNEPVVVVPKDFEMKLGKGELINIELLTASNNRSAQSATGRIDSLLEGFNRERTIQALAVRGVAAGSMKTMEVQEVDLANAQMRASQLTGMLPFFILMAVLYGALNAALDTTAGERERGSLEPLLSNPAPHWALVLGKFGAVALVGMMIAVLSALSFFPAQALLKSETLRAMFQYGPREAIAFIATLVPFAAALSAVLMAVAIRCKTFKEAQANNTLVILAVSMLPMVTFMNPGGEKTWHLWVPGLGQNLVMNRVLKGEALDATVIAIPLLSCLIITALGLFYISRHLQKAALK
jgi:sodium transport system permease protein